MMQRDFLRSALIGPVNDKAIINFCFAALGEDCFWVIVFDGKKI
jgi:hypothetical protein